MRSVVRLVAALLMVFGFVACSRDPNVAKRKYLESGNKYFDRGKYKEASLMYRNALLKDPKYGLGYYRLGLTQLKMNDVARAVGSFRRAVELVPPEQPESKDSKLKLAELYLGLSKDPKLIDEVKDIADAFLKLDSKSYEGHRLSAQYLLKKAQAAAALTKTDEARKYLKEAIAEYQKALQIDPKQYLLQIEMGKALAADGQVAEAEKSYRDVIAKDKSQSLAYIDLYTLYKLQNRNAEGEKVLKDAIAANPKQWRFLSLLAAHYSSTNQRSEMVQVLNRLKADTKEVPDAYDVVGNFYLRLGEGDEAIKQFTEGIAKDPKNKAKYQKFIIEALMRQGKRNEAAEVNAAILKDNPKDNDARGLQAAMMLDKGEVQKAIAELQSVISSAPKNFVVRFNLGRAYAARGDLELARQQFKESIEVRPDYLPPRLALTQVQVAKGEYDSALRSVEDILKIDPQNANAKLLESAAKMGQRKFDESRNLLEAMAKTNPNSSDVQFQLGVVDMAQNKFKEAEAAFRKSYELSPANSRGLLGVVESYMARNQPAQAMQILADAAVQSPGRADLLVAYGNTAVRSGKFDLAIEQFQKALGTVDPKSRAAADLWLRVGETMRRKGDLNGAIGALNKAGQMLPDNGPILATLGLTLDASNRKQEAKVAYERALKVEPMNGVALNNLAFLMAESGQDLDQALTLAQRAKQVLPNLYEVSDTLGWIYLKKNMSDNAIEIFRELVAKQPAHSTYRYHLGMALYQKGDRPRALQELNQALKSNPSRDEEGKIKDLMAKLQ